MATDGEKLGYGLDVAGADLSALQYHGVNFDGGAGAVAAGAGEYGWPLQNAPTLGQPIDLATAGVALVRAGAAVAKGAQMTWNAASRAITINATTDFVFGRALEAAAADGDIIRCMVTNEGQRQTT